MKKIILFPVILLTLCVLSPKVACQTGVTSIKTETNADSSRIAELNRFWDEVSRSVRDGDFEGYQATCHDEAVCVFTTGGNKYSVPMTVALARWKQGFADTKSGKNQDNVEFRFSQRVGDATTAHETGIFSFSSVDSSGKLITKSFIHFEELLVKRNGAWKVLMEYQISKGTQEEWDALRKYQ